MNCKNVAPSQSPHHWADTDSREPAACSCSTWLILQMPTRPSAGNVKFTPILPPHPPPADWWFKVGMWSTQMSSSRRSLSSRIISLTTHFSLSVSWLCNRDLPVCLMWGLTAATLLDPPWCILFSLKLIRGAIAYSIGLGEERVGFELYTWSEEKDFLLSRMNLWVFFNVSICRNTYTAMHGVGEMWQSNLVISLYIKHGSFITLQHHVPDSNRFIQVSRVQLYCPAQEDPGVGMWSQESRSGGTSRCLYSLCSCCFPKQYSIFVSNC